MLGRESPAPPDRPLGSVLLAVVFAFFGLLTPLAPVLGPTIGLVGVVLSARLRRYPGGLPAGSELLPALGALSILLLAAPADPSTELFGGLCVLLFLLWLASDPSAEPGGGRRAVGPLALASVSFAIAWGFSLQLSVPVADVAIGGALASVAVLLIAATLLRGLLAPRSETT